MSKKTVLLLCGGNSSEHEVSLVSANYIRKTLSNNPDITILFIIIGKDGVYRDEKGNIYNGLSNKSISLKNNNIPLDFVIPCFHGHPGETGAIQAFIESAELPYLGSNSEASIISLNKITSKLWYDALGIPNVPFTFLNTIDDIQKGLDALKKWDTVFIKASSQGSSIGCYRATNEKELKEFVKKAFNYSPWALIEKEVIGRELEIAVYEYNGKINMSKPGEILCSNNFYTYEEKYSEKSSTTTVTTCKDLNQKQITTLQTYAKNAFKALKLKHLSRVDFFLTKDNEIYLNEINTFPGMTPISMFPKLVINDGISFEDFLTSIIYA